MQKNVVWLLVTKIVCCFSVTEHYKDSEEISSTAIGGKFTPVYLFLHYSTFSLVRIGLLK